jgi:hypothetical protein
MAIPRSAAASILAWPLFPALRMEHDIRWRRMALVTLALALVAVTATLGAVLTRAASLLQDGIDGSSLEVIDYEVASVRNGWEEARRPVDPVGLWALVRALQPVVLDPNSDAPLRVTGHATFITAASRRAVEDAWSVGRTPPPIERARQQVVIASADASPSSLWRDRRRSMTGAAILLAAPPLVIGSLASACAFAALPHTLRQAKVRIAHVLRCLFYLLLGPVILLTLSTQLVATVVGRGGPAWRGYLSLELGDAMLLVPALALSALWWHRAITIYLRIPNAVAVTASVVTIGFLCMLLTDLLLRFGP